MKKNYSQESLDKIKNGRTIYLKSVKVVDFYPHQALKPVKNKKLGKGGMDLHNMDAATVAQMMHKMNPQMLAHLGGQQGLEQMMQEMEKEEKKINPNKRR